MYVITRSMNGRRQFWGDRQWTMVRDEAVRFRRRSAYAMKTRLLQFCKRIEVRRCHA